MADCRTLECPSPPPFAGWSHCSTCHENFTSDTSFDEHRTGSHGVDRRCMTVDEMSRKGLQADRRGYWKSSTAGRLSSLTDRSRVAETASDGGERT